MSIGARSADGPPGSEPAVLSERRHLINLAYRLLGSLVDAEDAVQETFARWYAMTPDQQAAVDVPAAWLTTVASRVCLDVLGSARARRERYVGEWVPEPLPGQSGAPGGHVNGMTADPADQITLDESVSMAFLVVLDSMTAAERVAFVLHDVFSYPFLDVAEVVGRTPGACRQLATSARRRIGVVRGTATPPDAYATIVRRFKTAWEAQDIAAIVDLLDPDATAVADGGGLANAILRPIVGGEKVAHYTIAITERVPALTITEHSVNGRPGLIARRDGATVLVIAFDIADRRITRIWAVRNPEKLRTWTAMMTSADAHPPEAASAPDRFGSLADGAVSGEGDEPVE